VRRWVMGGAALGKEAGCSKRGPNRGVWAGEDALVSQPLQSVSGNVRGDERHRRCFLKEERFGETLDGATGASRGK
jgi:hypothetical protein